MTNSADLFASARLILLDFDGPVTRLLPPPTNKEITDAIRRFALHHDVQLTAEESATTDHLAIIQAAARTPSALSAVEAYATHLEVAAARRSPITPGASELLQAARENGAAVVIVTNNSAQCASKFLANHNLTHLVADVLGRDPLHIDRMKPDPFILRESMRRQSGSPALMIGDSVSDAIASAAAGVPIVGMAKNAKREAELRDAKATATVRHLSELFIPAA